MQDLPIPEELLEYIEQEGAYTPFSEPIAYIFSNMIKEYMRATEILNVNENDAPDRVPKGYTTGLSKFNKVAAAIENEMRKNGNFDSKPLVQGSFLLSLCIPDKKQLNAGRSKKILIPTYIYLDRLLNDAKKRGGKKWIEKFKNDRKSNESKKEKNSFLTELKMEAAYLIDTGFKSELISLKDSITATEFYIGKKSINANGLGL